MKFTDKELMTLRNVLFDAISDRESFLSCHYDQFGSPMKGCVGIIRRTKLALRQYHKLDQKILSEINKN